MRSGGEIVCSAGVLWFQEKHTQLTDDPHSRQAGAVSVVSARNSFAAHGSSVPQKRSRRRTPSSVGVDLHTRRGRAPPAAGLRSPLWRSGPVASSEGPVLNCEGPPFARPGDSIRPRGPSCGACAAPRGPLEMVTRRRTDSSYVHMPHRAFSRLHARSLPSVRPARTPRRPRSGFVLARPQFTVSRRPLTASTTLPRLPSTRRGWIVPRARSC